MMHDTVVSPLNGNSQSVQDLPKQLSAEIREGIFHLGTQKRWKIEAEVNNLKGGSRNDVEYSLLLFRKYSAIAGQIKDHNIDLESRVTLPSIMPESGNDHRLLAGFDALRSNLFWLRLIAAMFAFISFMVMAMIPNFDHAHWDPGSSFYCNEYLNGSFKLRQYHFVIAVGVFIFVHILITTTYYLLPVNEQNEKYVPGLRGAFMSFVGQDEIAEEVMTGVHGCVRVVARYMECFVDFALVVMALVAFVIAAVCLDQPSQFTNPTDMKVVYFTLTSFWQTYSHTNPPCVNGDDDPTPSIRASLAMLFFAFLTMVVCLQVSYKTARSEWAHNSRCDYKDGASSGNSSGSGSARAGYGQEDSHFLGQSQSLPSSDSEHSNGSRASDRGSDRSSRGGNSAHQHSTNEQGGDDEEEEYEEAITFRSPAAVAV